MKYVDSKKLLDWFKKLNLIDVIFSETTHPEIIKKSKEIFSWMGLPPSQIGKKELDKIWNFQINKLESVQEAVFDVLKNVSQNLPKKSINYLYKKLL